MPVLGGRRKKRDEEGTQRILVDGITDPETCKAVKGKFDKRSGRCHIQVEKHPDHPKEAKVIEFDDYVSPESEGGTKSGDEA